MLCFFAAAVVSAVVAANNGAVDPGTIQSVSVVELDVTRADCKGPTWLDRDGRACGVVRRFDLKAIDRTRALALVNDNLKGAPKSCAQKPAHAFVFETTRGVRVVDVNFACHALGGRALDHKAERELATFMRLYGLVNGLGGL